MLSSIDINPEQLAATIADVGSNSSHPAINLYQRNLLAHAANALEITHPTLSALIGSEAMRILAKKLLALQPLQEGDWGAWGSKLPECIAEQAEMAHLPYLFDTAKLDWMCHVAERAANAITDFQSFSVLGTANPQEIYIDFMPSTHFIESEYPLREIWLAHHDKETAQWMKLANKPLPKNTKQYLVVARKKWKAIPYEVTQAEYRFMNALHRHASVGDALKHSEDQEFTFSEWIASAVHLEIINCVFQPKSATEYCAKLPHKTVINEPPISV